jgi:large subunit ribosomal protein L30
MITAIRIRGDVGIDAPVRETLNRLRLRRKYACIVLEKPTKEQIGMIHKMKDFVAFGEIDDATYKKLVNARGQKDSNGKLKPFFRLHPPRGGIESKKHFGIGKGVLGNHKDKIKDLLEKML